MEIKRPEDDHEGHRSPALLLGDYLDWTNSNLGQPAPAVPILPSPICPQTDGSPGWRKIICYFKKKSISSQFEISYIIKKDKLWPPNQHIVKLSQSD
ncbi:hypothetical protein H8959_021818 [Pygathrix nigripes]